MPFGWLTAFLVWANAVCYTLSKIRARVFPLLFLLTHFLVLS